MKGEGRLCLEREAAQAHQKSVGALGRDIKHTADRNAVVSIGPYQASIPQTLKTVKGR